MDILKVKEQILTQLPIKFRNVFSKHSFLSLQEIRFRCGKPLMIYGANGGEMLSEQGKTVCEVGQAFLVSREDMLVLFGCFCENSVYAYQNEICEGFLTIRGGHRVGICGRCVMSEGKISNIADISGFNLRIAKEYIGCAEKLLPQILLPNHSMANTILLAPPQCGKTTFLRDLTRLLSRRFKISLIDERSEIAAVKDGIAQLDVGLQTDVLDQFPKREGMLFALRSLSPEIMVTDELGTEEDVKAVKRVLHSGCRILTTMHAESEHELRGEQRKLYDLFEKAVILSRKNGIPTLDRTIEIAKPTLCFGEGGIC